MRKQTFPTPPFIDLRVQAVAILNGPRDITIPAKKGDKFYGWPMLTLELKSAQGDYIECRSVYANLFNKSQKSAILRATSWDGNSARADFYRDPNRFKLQLPARFVEIPIRRLRSWLACFDGIQIELKNIHEVNEEESIRRLRIERDYKSQTFEKMWQLRNSDNTELRSAWDNVWFQMTKSLLTAPRVENLAEGFWFVMPEIRYDFQKFTPDFHATR